MEKKLSEEEIKDTLIILEDTDISTIDNAENVDLRTYQLAVNNLLDLYNKEKEKREIAEENHKVLCLDLGQALKGLGLPEDTIIADELVLEINKKYISKDKVKEKIEEYDKMIKATYGDMTVSGKYRRDVCLEIKQNLQELLGKGE